MKQKEIDRLEKMTIYEKSARSDGFSFIAGIDEVGRGPLAGPVVAAAVILPEDFMPEGLNDSKKVSPGKRELLYDIIVNNSISFGVGIVDEKIVDEINILNATKQAMNLAINNLHIRPDILLIDAVTLENVDIAQKAIIKGDSLSISIAAASILAKVTRDRIIVDFANKYPEYGFERHKGYGTPEHIRAIEKYGLCPIHRISFTKRFT
jgi:ribonuclease HII